MTQLNQIYKCNICGNIVEVVHIGVGQLVCCGQPMELQKEKIADIGKEKHIPIIERTGSGIKVKVSSIPHPLEENHYIEWIEILTETNSYKYFLKPGDNPKAEFDIKNGNITARAYCNQHGLWKS